MRGRRKRWGRTRGKRWRRRRRKRCGGRGGGGRGEDHNYNAIFHSNAAELYSSPRQLFLSSEREAEKEQVGGRRGDGGDGGEQLGEEGGGGRGGKGRQDHY